MKYEFPKDFIWGVATAAQQIEGGMTDGGRGLSNWDVFSCIPGKINKGGVPDVACDSYHLVERDVEMLRELGEHTAQQPTASKLLAALLARIRAGKS